MAVITEFTAPVREILDNGEYSFFDLGQKQKVSIFADRIKFDEPFTQMVKRKIFKKEIYHISKVMLKHVTRVNRTIIDEDMSILHLSVPHSKRTINIILSKEKAETTLIHILSLKYKLDDNHHTK